MSQCQCCVRSRTAIWCTYWRGCWKEKASPSFCLLKLAGKHLKMFYKGYMYVHVAFSLLSLTEVAMCTLCCYGRWTCLVWLCIRSCLRWGKNMARKLGQGIVCYCWGHVCTNNGLGDIIFYSTISISALRHFQL